MKEDPGPSSYPYSPTFRELPFSEARVQEVLKITLLNITPFVQTCS